MKKFEDLDSEDLQKVLTMIGLAISHGCTAVGLENPRFALFLFNDSNRQLLTTNTSKKEVLREVSNTLYRLANDDENEGEVYPPNQQ